MFQAGPKIDQDTQVSPALNFSTCFMEKHENYETSRIRKMGGPGPVEMAVWSQQEER